MKGKFIGLKVNKEKAEYKKTIMENKNKSWKNYCSTHKKKFEKLFKIAHGKIFKPHHILVEGIRKEFKTQQEAENMLIHHFFPLEELLENYKQMTDNIQVGNYKRINKYEIRRALKSVDMGKAPGVDEIDYRILNNVHYANEDLLVSLYNSCTRLSHFPTSLKRDASFPSF